MYDKYFAFSVLADYWRVISDSILLAIVAFLLYIWVTLFLDYDGKK
jgi:hypothetical protein